MASADYTAKVSELASRYVADNVRSWQRYADTLRRVTESAMPAAEAAANGAPRGDVRTFARQLVQLNLTHYTDLLNTYAEFTSRILTTIFPAHANANATKASARPTPGMATGLSGGRIELVFSGVTGELVSQSFAVANKRAEPINVSFELTEFLSEDDATRFRVPVTFVPDKFVLSPGAEQIVDCRVALVPAFRAGTRYMALVRVTGFPTLETALIVLLMGPAGSMTEDVEPTAAAPTMEAAGIATQAEDSAAKVVNSPTASAGTRKIRKTGKTRRKPRTQSS